MPAVVLLGVLAGLCLPMAKGPFEINGDTSWLIHVAEQMLAGARVYVDVIETNPPMSVFLYTPAVWLARVSGFTAETLVYAQTWVVALLSLALSGRIAGRHLGMGGQALGLVLATMAIAFLLVPSRSFTQREHFAVMLAVPAMLCLAARAEGATPSHVLALICGVLAGLAASIKPHFVLAVAFPTALGAMYLRSWRVLFVPEALGAAAVFVVYAAVWLLAFPAFFDAPLFLTRNAYLLYTYGLADYFRDLPSLVLILTAMFVMGVLIAVRWRSGIVVVSGGFAAFALAFILQGKGFAYHLYPIAALGLILAGLGTVRRSAMTLAMLGGIAACAYVSALYSEKYPETADLRRAIVAEKARPSLIIFTFDIAVNFPLVRQIDGIWASRLVSTWASNSAGHALKGALDAPQLARTRQVISLERTWLAEDVARNQPDILVFDGPAIRDAMLTHDGFRKAFEGRYRPVGTAQDERFLLYRRNGG